MGREFCGDEDESEKKQSKKGDDFDTSVWPVQKCKLLFICQKTKSSSRTKHLNLTYTKDQLNFTSFHVWYKYKATSQELLKSSREKRMGGFRLGWRIEKPTLSESKVGRSIQSLEHDKIFAGALGHDDKVTLMTSMVQMAQDFRLTQNMTEDEVLNKIIKEKLQNESIWGISKNVSNLTN